MHRAFKVLYRNQDRYYSAGAAFCYNSSIDIEYRIGRWIEPTLRGSQLFVFSDLACAEAFQSTVRGCALEIWVCDCIGLEKINSTARMSIRGFWAERDNYQRRQSISLPAGSHITQALRGLERV